MGSNALTPKGRRVDSRLVHIQRTLSKGGGLRGRERGPCTTKEEGLADPKSALIEISTLR